MNDWTRTKPKAPGDYLVRHPGMAEEIKARVIQRGRGFRVVIEGYPSVSMSDIGENALEWRRGK